MTAVALAVLGCHSDLFQRPQWMSQRPAPPSEVMVVPRPGGQPTDLSADDVIRVMRHLGVPDPQILSLGPSLRDALRSTGAGAFVRDRQVEAMLAINGDYLFIQSVQQGSSIYDIKDKQFAAVPPMSVRGD
jgi:hypothetical protein